VTDPRVTPSVLLVDDDESTLERLRHQLRAWDEEWDLTFALGAAPALEALTDRVYDVVVADAGTPGTNGESLLEAVQERHPGLVRVALSERPGEATALRASAVAHRILTKPIDEDDLRRVVERAAHLRSTLHNDDLRRAITASGSLPPAPSVYVRLTSALADPDAGVQEVAEIVASDPAIVVKLLQLVNSAFFGLGRRITSVREAVSYLGIVTIRALVLSTATFDGFKPPRRIKGFSSACLREHSLLVGKIAAKLVDDRALANDAFMAGILHDVGKLVLAAHEPEYLEQAYEHAFAQNLMLHEAERELRGATHGEIGAFLLALWGLPLDVVEAAALHDVDFELRETLDVLDSVRVANLLAFEQQPACTWPASDKVGERLKWLEAEDGPRLKAWRELAADEAGSLRGGILLLD
jgi:HD-like signal output (HDOD) protein/CheY-like chemotaxis protein